jgi:hypothetical protein
LAEEDSFSRKEGISCDIKVPNAVYALKGMLSDILNNTSPPPMYLLIDALNECVSGLSNLLHIMKDDSFARRSRVKWLVTSHNVLIIKQR